VHFLKVSLLLLLAFTFQRSKLRPVTAEYKKMSRRYTLFHTMSLTSKQQWT